MGAQQTVGIRIHPDEVIARLRPTLYGAGMEDVNHEVYGGIYSQRIFGESFEEGAPVEGIKGFVTDGSPWYEETQGMFPKVNNKFARATVEGTGMRSGSVEVDFRFESVRPSYGGITLLREGNDADEFGLWSTGDQVVVRNQGADPVNLASVNVYGINQWDWNTLKVEFGDGAYKIYLNGDLILVTRNPDAAGALHHPGLFTRDVDATFRNMKVNGKSVPFETVHEYDVSHMWTPYCTPGSKASFAISRDNPYNGKQSQVFSNDGKGRVGVTNMSLNHWGIAVKKGQEFKGEVFLKGSAKKLYVALQDADGTKEYARMKIDGSSKDWAKRTFTLKSSATDPKARFAIYMEGKGCLDVDQIYLSATGDALYKGLPFRADIAQGLVDEGLTFLRYGGSMINASDYSFKNMTGPRDKRTPTRGQWYHFHSNGFAIPEFLQLAEACGFEASFAVNVEEDPETMADMVRYLKSPEDTPWGQKRAQDGHPAPYKVKYIEIGNEEALFWQNEYYFRHYVERFNLLADAMLAVDPTLELVCAAWWIPERKDLMELTYKGIDGKAKWWDLHTTTDRINRALEVEGLLTQMEAWFKEWNPDGDMKCAIFEENGATHNMLRALGHAINLNAVRRHGDFVLTTSAANALEPYLQNDNAWNQGQVFFTPDQVWGMPPFYATRMAAQAHQNMTVRTEVSGNVLDASSTVSDNGDLVITHIVNPTADTVPVTLTVDGISKPSKIKAVILSGDPDDRNSPDAPEKIVPREEKVRDLKGVSLKPWSYTILYIYK